MIPSQSQSYAQWVILQYLSHQGLRLPDSCFEQSAGDPHRHQLPHSFMHNETSLIRISLALMTQDHARTANRYPTLHVRHTYSKQRYLH